MLERGLRVRRPLAEIGPLAQEALGGFIEASAAASFVAEELVGVRKGGIGVGSLNDLALDGRLRRVTNDAAPEPAQEGDAGGEVAAGEECVNRGLVYGRGRQRHAHAERSPSGEVCLR